MSDLKRVVPLSWGRRQAAETRPTAWLWVVLDLRRVVSLSRGRRQHPLEMKAVEESAMIDTGRAYTRL